MHYQSILGGSFQAGFGFMCMCMYVTIFTLHICQVNFGYDVLFVHFCGLFTILVWFSVYVCVCVTIFT